nr:hypothetical transcript [Hymenolepis microstoma]
MSAWGRANQRLLENASVRPWSETTRVGSHCPLRLPVQPPLAARLYLNIISSFGLQSRLLQFGFYPPHYPPRYSHHGSMTSQAKMQTIILLLLAILHHTSACKYLRAIQILETSALQRTNPSTYIPSLPGIAQEVSVNLTKLFQSELSISTEEAQQAVIFFTDATESRPFVIKQLKDGSRILTNEMAIDREEICDPFKYPHHAAVSQKCCEKERGDGEYKKNPFNPQLDFNCCVFLGITVEGYGTFSLRIDVVDVNDNIPSFSIPPEASLGHAGKDKSAIIKIDENIPQGTIIPLPQAFDLDEGKNSDLLFRVEKVSPLAAWEQHFKLMSSPEDSCVTYSLTESRSRDNSFPALCLLGTIDRETVPGFTFDLVARDQGDPVALSTTLSMSISINFPTRIENASISVQDLISVPDRYYYVSVPGGKEGGEDWNMVDAHA